MNQTEFIKFASELSKKTKSPISQNKLKEFLPAFKEAVKDALGNGDFVHLNEFGEFMVHEIPAGGKYDINTGKKMDLPARSVPILKFSRYFKNKLNGIKGENEYD